MLELSSSCGAGGHGDCGRELAAVLVSQAVVRLAGQEGPAVRLLRHRGHRRHRGALAGAGGHQPATVPAVPGGVLADLSLAMRVSPPAPAPRLVVARLGRPAGPVLVRPLLSLLAVLLELGAVVRLAMPSSHKYRESSVLCSARKYL